MRKWMLFLGLGLTIGLAVLWHYARLHSIGEKDVEIAVSRGWDPEVLRDTDGEIVLGGGPAPAAPSRSELEQAPQLQHNDARPLPASTEKKPEAPIIEEEIYTVQSGDTLGDIAKRKYGSVAPRFIDAIAKKNSLKNPNALKVGMKLVLPESSSIPR